MNEFEELLDRWTSGVISLPEKDRFKELLKQPECRRQLVLDFMQSSMLIAVLEETASAESSNMSEPQREPAAWEGVWELLVSAGRALLRPGPAFAVAAILFALVSYHFYFPANDAPRLVFASGGELIRGAQIEAGAGEKRLKAGDIIQTRDRGHAVLSYGDGTTIDIAERSRLRLTGVKYKIVELQAGTVRVAAAKQPAAHPMILETPTSKATVVGTRFALTANPGAAWLDVEEGSVRFASKTKGQEPIMVGANHFAVAGSGVEFIPRDYDVSEGPVASVPIPADWKNSSIKGDGNWCVDNGMLWQQIVTSGVSWPILWSTPEDPTSSVEINTSVRGSVLIESEVVVYRYIDPSVPAPARWKGFACRFGAGGQMVKFYFVGNGPKEGLLKLTLGETKPQQMGVKQSESKCAPFLEGRYHIKMLVDRLGNGRVNVSGKLWQGDTEPSEWMVHAEMPIAEAIQRIGFETTHCACAFYDFKAALVR